MAGDVNRDLRRHLANLVSALIALSPSRNLVTQFLYFAGANKGGVDYRVFEEAYPEIVKDGGVRESFGGAFGVLFGGHAAFEGKIALEQNKYGWRIFEFVDGFLLKAFGDPEFRSALSSLLAEEFPGGVPDLAREWVEVRVRGLSSEPTYGGKALAVLREIVGSKKVKFEDLERKLGFERGELLECLGLIELYGLVKKDAVTKSYEPADALKSYPDVLEAQRSG